MKVLSQQGYFVGIGATIGGGLTTVENATVIRIYNSAATTGTVNIIEYEYPDTYNTIATISIPAGKVEYIQKKPEQYVEGDNTINYTKIAYSPVMQYASWLEGGGGGSSPSYVTSNLRMHLDADSYSGSGDWLDATSNGNDGTITGSTYVSASGGNPAYFGFDGTDDDVSITDTYSGGTAGGLKTYDLLSGNNNYSFSLWFQTGAFPANTNWQISPVMFKAGRRSIYILHGDSTAVDKLAFHGNWASGSWSQRVESDTLSLDTWYNICFTYNTTNGFVCYQNGSSVDTDSSPNNAYTFYNSNSYIGRVSNADSYTSQRYWEGKMAILSIYEETLTPSEVTQNYDAFKSRYGLS